MKLSTVTISIVLAVIISFVSWAIVIVCYPAKPPMGQSTEKFTLHYTLSPAPPFLFKYYLYKPYQYNPQQKYPLVLMLHGASRHMRGGIGASSYEVQQEHEMFVVVPIAPPYFRWATSDGGLLRATSMAKSSVSRVMKKYAVDPARIYVTGYSLGGAGTFGMVKKYPELFAAAIPLCGYWSERLEDYKEIAAADIPIRIHHGTADQYVAYKNSQSAFYALQTLNADVELISYQGKNHNIWDDIYTDMEFWDWLNSQKRTR